MEHSINFISQNIHKILCPIDWCGAVSLCHILFTVNKILSQVSKRRHCNRRWKNSRSKKNVDSVGNLTFDLIPFADSLGNCQQPSNSEVGLGKV